MISDFTSEIWPEGPEAPPQRIRNPAPPPARRAGDGRGMGETHDAQRTTPRTAPQSDGGPRAQSGGEAAQGEGQRHGKRRRARPDHNGGPRPAGAQRGRAAARSGPSANAGPTTGGGPAFASPPGDQREGRSAARRRGTARRPAGRRSTLECLPPMAANIRTAWADGGGPWPPSGRLPSASDAVGRS